MNKDLLKRRGGIRLDIGCGSAKQPGFVGMDLRKLPTVDIVHDAQVFPYPLPDDCCVQILLSHLWEHIEPKHRINLMNELWRISRVGAQLLISSPYYLSFGALQDPTHYGCPNEATFRYFDPTHPLWNIYEAKPWKIIQNNYAMTGNMEVIMEKILPKEKQ